MSWPGWCRRPETAELAEAFIADALARQGIGRDQLSLHADPGTSMTSKPVTQLLVDLGVARSDSRPHVSNDSRFSEANFKTLKYCPAFPGRFRHHRRRPGVLLDVLRPLQPRPPPRRYRTAYARLGPLRHRRRDPRRAGRTLDAAYAANPGRFRHRPPSPPKLPTVAWINEPTAEALIRSA
jgi:putative transposase